MIRSTWKTVRSQSNSIFISRPKSNGPKNLWCKNSNGNDCADLQQKIVWGRDIEWTKSHIIDKPIIIMKSNVLVFHLAWKREAYSDVCWDKCKITSRFPISPYLVLVHQRTWSNYDSIFSQRLRTQFLSITTNDYIFLRSKFLNMRLLYRVSFLIIIITIQIERYI